MHFEQVANSPERQAPVQAVVGSDGVLRLSEGILSGIGAGPGDCVEVIATDTGLRVLPKDPAPRKLYVELTTECNLDCAMCLRHSWETAGGAMEEATFGRLLKQCDAFPGLQTINFSGFGEPFVHPRALDWLARVKATGRAAEVVSNGLLLGEADLEHFVAIGLDRLIVSLDGVAPDAGRLLHGDTSNNVLALLRGLKELKLREAATFPEVTIEFVATAHNLDQLPVLRRLTPELGVSHILVTNVVPYTAELADGILYEHWTTGPSLRRPSAWVPEVDLPAMDAAATAAVLRGLQPRGTILSVAGGGVAGVPPRCRFVTEGRLAVRWDGHVSPCLPLMHAHTCYFRQQRKRIRCHHVGNINHRDLSEIWRADEYRAFRQTVRSFDFAPCLDCGGCDLRETNEEDCYYGAFPRCGECMWAAGLVQCV